MRERAKHNREISMRERELTTEERAKQLRETYARGRES